MRDSWTPSPEDEYRCGHCAAGAGTTAQRDNVEEFGVRDDDDDDSDTEHSGVLDADKSGGSESTALWMFHFGLSWIVSLQTDAYKDLTNVPHGEALCHVLRLTFELSSVLVLPSMAPSSALVLRSASLFLALAAQSFSVPFPLFVLGRSCAAVQQLSSSTPSGAGASAGSSGVAGVIGSASANDDLQWIDIEAAASQVGLPLPQFFESPTAMAQFMQNSLARLVHEFNVPSVLWSMDRVEGRYETVAAMQSRAQGHLSPEHRAAVVALELARAFEAEHNPLAPENATTYSRVSDWYKDHTQNPQLSGFVVLFNTTTAAVDSDEVTRLSFGSAEDVGPSPPAAESVAVPELSFLPTSRLADLLLRMFCRAFRMMPLAFSEMVEESRCYDGPTNFYILLQSAAAQGQFHALPLYRRVTAVSSPWLVVHRALHSEDRLPLLTALSYVAGATVREREVPAAKLVQRICRKHGASTAYKFYYAIRCVDPEEKHMHGLYVCTFVSSRFAVFTCIRSGRKTITYNASTGGVSLCYLGSKERVVEKNALQVVWVGPLTAAVEGQAAKYVMDCSRSGLHLADWTVALQKLHVCSVLRMGGRTSPFPTWSWTQIRALLIESATRTDPDSQLSGSAGAYAFSAATLERLALREIVSVPNPAILRGASEDAILVWYHLLYVLAEARSDLMSHVGRAAAPEDAAISTAQYEARLFGCPGRPRHRQDDAETCLEDVIRCVRALRTGVRADVSEEQVKRAQRRRRREEELKLQTWNAE